MPTLRSPWAYRIVDACWITERLEHVLGWQPASNYIRAPFLAVIINSYAKLVPSRFHILYSSIVALALYILVSEALADTIRNYSYLHFVNIKLWQLQIPTSPRPSMRRFLHRVFLRKKMRSTLRTKNGSMKSSKTTFPRPLI